MAHGPTDPECEPSEVPKCGCGGGGGPSTYRQPNKLIMHKAKKLPGTSGGEPRAKLTCDLSGISFLVKTAGESPTLFLPLLVLVLPLSPPPVPYCCHGYRCCLPTPVLSPVLLLPPACLVVLLLSDPVVLPCITVLSSLWDSRSGMDRFLQVAYRTVALMTFFFSDIVCM